MERILVQKEVYKQGFLPFSQLCTSSFHLFLWPLLETSYLKVCSVLDPRSFGSQIVMLYVETFFSRVGCCMH